MSPDELVQEVGALIRLEVNGIQRLFEIIHVHVPADIVICGVSLIITPNEPVRLLIKRRDGIVPAATHTG